MAVLLARRGYIVVIPQHTDGSSSLVLLKGGKDLPHSHPQLVSAHLLALGDFDVVGAREEGVTGVFVGGRKIASVGVKVRRWTTMHGIGVNVGRESLGNFQGIKPCGMDRDVTCLEDCCDREVTVEVFGEAFCRAFEKVFNCVWK